MTLLPHRFLVRLAHPCRYVKDVPHEDDDDLLDLTASCRIDGLPALDDRTDFADVRLAWNEGGLAVQVTVTGKSQAAIGDADKPRSADGLTLWLDTRGDRTSHRASRFCHQFHLLPTGGGRDKDHADLLQTKINRALADAPVNDLSTLPFRYSNRKGGYRLEAFLTTAVLNGFDPDEHPELGFYYVMRDQELGEQTLGVGSEFPYADDPSLWAVLSLEK